MNDLEFNEQIGRLFDVFGDKAFSKGRLNRIKEIMEDRPRSMMKQLVDRFIDANRYAPMPKDFAEAVRAVPLQISKIQVEGCKDCDEGLIIAVPKEGNATRAAFRCPCPAGSQHSSQIPLWGPAYECNYKPGWDAAPSLTLWERKES